MFGHSEIMCKKKPVSKEERVENISDIDVVPKESVEKEGFTKVTYRRTNENSYMQGSTIKVGLEQVLILRIKKSNKMDLVKSFERKM